MSWQATVLTIFPEMLPGPLAHSLAGKARAASAWLRSLTPDKWPISTPLPVPVRRNVNRRLPLSSSSVP